MKNLTAALGGPEIFIKRDDCTGLAMGGNKARQLEFYLGAARAQKADTILITGAVQSNYVRMAAAGARLLGMDCHIQLEERVAKNDPAYRNSGNVLLDRILGATIHSYPDGEDEEGADNQLEVIAGELRGRGANPYIIHLGPGFEPLGALGYVVCAREILDQLASLEMTIDEIFVASGSGATHAGLLAGLRSLGSSIPVTGVCVRRDAVAQRPRILKTTQTIAGMLEIDPVVMETDVRIEDAVLAPGYGMLNDETLEALKLLARHEGVILDPVYTAKSAAGMIHRIREKELAGDGPVLFVHTGGVPAAFAYEAILTQEL